MPVVRLKAGHVQPVWAGHPWVYAQAIDRVDAGVGHGDEVSVEDPRGNVLGRGFYSPKSAIPVRILTRDDAPFDAAFFEKKIARALEVRLLSGFFGEATDGYRVVHAEGDGLPGLVVDRAGDVAIVQLLTAGMKRREDLVLSAIEAAFSPRAILDRTPASVAQQEGFAPVSDGVGKGRVVARGKPVDVLAFKERGFSYRIPLALGQKTGFYFDQRDLRGRVEAMSRGARVLDTYAYVGAFSMAAARGGASEVTAVDESATAIEVAAAVAKDNGLEGKITFTKRDAREALAAAEGDGGRDLVVVDPPRLARTKKSRDGALHAYAKLAELGCRATTNGGTLVLCSCSAAVDLLALTRALATGAARAGRSAIVTERIFQGIDHPVPAAFGEGLYLKALVARMEPL